MTEVEHPGKGAFDCNGRRYCTPVTRTLAICIDGTAPAYLENALERRLMPRLAAALASEGDLLIGRAQIPTLTNVNNMSIVTGVSAAVHGVAGNHYRTADGRETQLTDPSALRAETILAAARRAGITALAVTAKDKLRGLLGAGDVPAISAEHAHRQTLEGLDGATGTEIVGRSNPSIYDPDLSGYAIDLALALADRLGATLVYCSLTDFVQHKAAPGEPLADRFYSDLDERLGRALEAGWSVGMAADHGMNSKARPDGTPNVHYLEDVLTSAGICGDVILPITDPYVVHHGALGSVAYVYVATETRARARALLAGLHGVEAILDRSAAARAFDLPPDRIGDLVVLADAATVVGKSRAAHDLSGLASPLRSHGGLAEQEVPIVSCGRSKALGHLGDLRNADLFDLLLDAA